MKNIKYLIIKILLDIKFLVVKKLVESKFQKYDRILNAFIPIKRARVIYRAFGMIVVN
jgi:hypothetical protein